jgi:hypothetical protein
MNNGLIKCVDTMPKMIAVIKEIVAEEVDFMFRDVIETGQGIGSSDITACMNACVPAVNGRFDIDLPFLCHLIHNAIGELEEEVMA